MGNCSSDERPANTVGTAPVAHHPGAYQQHQVPQQPYLPPAHATPASYPSQQQQPYAHQSQPSAYPSQTAYQSPYQAQGSAGAYPSQTQSTGYPSQYAQQQPYQSAPSPLPSNGPYSTQPPAYGGGGQSAGVPLQPYSRSNSSRMAASMGQGQAPMIAPTSSMRQSSRIDQLRAMFPGADDAVLKLAIEQSTEPSKQEQYLTQLTGQQPVMQSAPMETTASLINQRARFRVDQPVDALFDGQYHPATVNQIHAQPTPGGGGMQFQYTVCWLEDKSVTLVNEGEMRERL